MPHLGSVSATLYPKTQHLLNIRIFFFELVELGGFFVCFRFSLYLCACVKLMLSGLFFMTKMSQSLSMSVLGCSLA